MNQRTLFYLLPFCLDTSSATTCHNTQSSDIIRSSISLILPEKRDESSRSVIVTTFKNISKSDVRITLVGPKVQNPLIVYDSKNNVVWDRYGVSDQEDMALIIDLKPGESKLYATTWNMRDLNNYSISAGTYRIVSSFREADEIPTVSCTFKLM